MLPLEVNSSLIEGLKDVIKIVSALGVFFSVGISTIIIFIMLNKIMVSKILKVMCSLGRQRLESGLRFQKTNKSNQAHRESFISYHFSAKNPVWIFSNYCFTYYIIAYLDVVFPVVVIFGKEQ